MEEYDSISTTDSGLYRSASEGRRQHKLPRARAPRFTARSGSRRSDGKTGASKERTDPTLSGGGGQSSQAGHVRTVHNPCPGNRGGKEGQVTN